MTFRAPLQDFKFVFDHLAGLDKLLQMPAFAGVEPDLIDAVLAENARFTEEVVAPTNWDGDQRPPSLKDGVVTVTPSFHKVFKSFADGGWQGLRHPEGWGGQGLPNLLATATNENLFAANMAFSLCPLLTDGVIEALLLAGDDQQKKRYVPALIEGRWTGTMNLTEPQAGSDLSLVSAKAVPQDDGTYRVFGQKIYITFGEHDLAENIVHLVLARTVDAPSGVKGLSLFIVPKYLVNDDGSTGLRNDVWCASIEHKLGIHGSPTAVLLYGDEKGEVGKGAVATLVGEENRGLEYMFIMMNAARFAVGVQGIGISERATQQALAYARDRVQSRAIEGSAAAVPIIQHPDVQRMLSTMRGLTEAARAIACCAAAAHDLGSLHQDETVRQFNESVYDYLVPIVKGFSTECSLEVTSLGVQIHGGMGFIEETGAAQYYRDARILTIYEGTTAIQANDLVGRKTLRNGGVIALGLVQSMRATLAELSDALASAKAAQQPGLAMLVHQFALAIDAYEGSIQYVLSHAKDDTRAVYTGSVPYLMLAGYALGGWQMVRSALVCARELSVSDDQFLVNKFATAVFYGAYLLPRTGTLYTSMRNGEVVSQALAQSRVD